MVKLIMLHAPNSMVMIQLRLYCYYILTIHIHIVDCIVDCSGLHEVG